MERRQDADDRRAMRVRATADGRERARAANRAVEEVDEAAFGAGGGETQPLVEQLSEVFRRLRE